MKSYTAEELKSRQEESRTDLGRVDSITEEELERSIAEDQGEAGFLPDWTMARLVLPEAKKDVHLRLDREVIEFFKSQGKGHISRMQAVLKAYVESHRRRAE